MNTTFYVYSTLSNDNVYVNHRRGGNDMPIADGNGILIRGGANVPDKRLITPAGVVTIVTADEIEYLRQNEVFKVHEKNGYITVSSEKVDAEVAAADMESRDPGAPLVPGDFAPDEQPVVNADPENKVADAAPTRANSRRA
jgi:hypothetical protein